MFKECRGFLAWVCMMGVVACVGSGSAEPCRKVYTTTSFCSGCPGFQFCACIYEGAECVDRIMCNREKDVTEEGTDPAVDISEICYYRTSCRSKNGGLCHPTQNPCETYGMTSSVAVMPSYQQTTGECETSGNPD